MPEALWAEAVGLAVEVGAYAAARGIGVDIGSLRARLRAHQSAAGKGNRATAKGSFVDAGSVAELAASSAMATVEAVLPCGGRVVVRVATGAEAVAAALLRELRKHAP
jgi:hypothetical protein